MLQAELSNYRNQKIAFSHCIKRGLIDEFLAWNISGVVRCNLTFSFGRLSFFTITVLGFDVRPSFVFVFSLRLRYLQTLPPTVSSRDENPWPLMFFLMCGNKENPTRWTVDLFWTHTYRSMIRHLWRSYKRRLRYRHRLCPTFLYTNRYEPFFERLSNSAGSNENKVPYRL